VKLERMDPARRPLQSQAEGVAELHANAFQKVLDMPSLPNSFRKQVADLQFCSRIFANGVLPIAWLTLRFWHVLISPTTLTIGKQSWVHEHCCLTSHCQLHDWTPDAQGRACAQHSTSTKRWWIAVSISCEVGFKVIPCSPPRSTSEQVVWQHVLVEGSSADC